MNKGDLLKNKQTGEFATIITQPWVKLWRDDSDWEAARYGFDSATAATAIKICYHKTGVERVFKESVARQMFDIITENTNEN